jgi:hypothetical protein
VVELAAKETNKGCQWMVQFSYLMTPFLLQCSCSVVRKKKKKKAHVLDGLHVSIGSDPIARGATAADSVAA